MKRLSARSYIDSELKAGKASTVIEVFDLKPGDEVVLAIRKAGRERPDNLDAQEANLRAVVEAAGAIVVGVVSYAGSGFDCQWVLAAVGMAKRIGVQIVLAETTDRFVRSIYYHSDKCPDVQATAEQLKELALYARGVEDVPGLVEKVVSPSPGLYIPGVVISVAEGEHHHVTRLSEVVGSSQVITRPSRSAAAD